MSLGLYLHIPFCESICGYCNFNRGLFDSDLKRRYVAALEREIRSSAEVEIGAPSPSHGRRPADTIFFGGGTPSLLAPDEVRRLLTACRDAFTVASGAEVTLETNPESAAPARLEAFREAGVNRISFGVQSFDDEELRRLDRLHSAGRAKAAVRDARRAGFSNLSFDLMFWLPGQSLASWRRTLAEAVALEPDHLSLYLLELYPNAPLRDAMARARGGTPGGDGSRWLQAADDEAADMYLEALDRLDAAGFRQYEISNVARPGFFSRHNVKYWQGGNWQGFGCGAHSTVAGDRWRNVAPIGDYIDRMTAARPVAIDRHRLGEEERVSEALFTGLRLTAGISGRNFLDRYGVEPWRQYGEALGPWVDAGHVWRAGDQFGLTRRGMLVANEVLQVFV